MANLGDRGFMVEWCIETPTDENGDTEPDLWKYKRRVLSELSAAMSFAKLAFIEAVTGVVEVYPVEFVDPYGDGIRKTFKWECVGDSEYYNGEENCQKCKGFLQPKWALCPACCTPVASDNRRSHEQHAEFLPDGGFRGIQQT